MENAKKPEMGAVLQVLNSQGNHEIETVLAAFECKATLGSMTPIDVDTIGVLTRRENGVLSVSYWLDNDGEARYEGGGNWLACERTNSVMSLAIPAADSALAIQHRNQIHDVLARCDIEGIVA